MYVIPLFRRSEMESALSANDSFCLNFAQFYQLLLRISHVVYPELHHEQPCIAMNKLLQVYDITTVIDYIRIVLRGISPVTINRIVVSCPHPTSTPSSLLQESILPLYAWSQGHAKRGSVDELVKEERVVLILATYAPNIWKVSDQRVFGISCYL